MRTGSATSPGACCGTTGRSCVRCRSSEGHPSAHRDPVRRLDVALRELAGRTPLPVTVHIGPERYPDDVAAAAYFVACEALTNAAKHSGARRVELAAGRVDGRLVLTVRDDGSGGAEPGRGSGLRGLADRVAAHGGRLLVESRPGAGTTIIAELPCES